MRINQIMCKLTKFLFWLAPIKKWQARILRGHFRMCDSCQKAFESDDNLKEVLFSPADTAHISSIGPEVMQKIQQNKNKKTLQLPQKQQRRFTLFTRWQWVTAMAAGFLLVLGIAVFHLFVLEKQPKPGEKLHPLPQPTDVVIHYVKSGGKHARTFIVKENKANRTFIWFEKY